MSATARKHKAQRLEVPHIDEDPAERKRVLNVLAQRRYRRRKKVHLHNLEHPAQPESPVSADSSDSVAINQIGLSLNRLSSTGTRVTAGKEPSSLGQCIPDSGVGDELQQLVVGASGASQLPEESVCLDSTSFEAWDACFDYALPSLPASPSLTMVTTTPSSSMTQSTRSQSTSFDFADEAYMPMLELNILNSAMAIAQRLGVDSLMWSLETQSPFHNSTVPTYTHLPHNLRPTTMQLRNAHHPMLDILPWPTVRDKLIFVFSQPEHLRPPSARSPTALLDFVYDLEDSAEGVRISGYDPYSDENWEVGEMLFKNWWWALDGKILRRTNQLRRDRGAAILRTDRVREIN